MRYHQMCVTGGMLLASLVGGAVGGMLMDARVGAQGAGVVTTTQVNIVDASGQLRATLTGRDERAMAAVAFYDPAGRVRAIFGLDETGSPIMRMMTDAGESRLVATVQRDDALLVAGDQDASAALVGSVEGRPVVSLGEGNRARLRLQLDAGGAPFLGMYDSQGQQAASMVVDSADSSFVTLYERGRARATLGVTQGTSLINLSDAEQPRFVAGVADNGRPSLTFLDLDGDVLQSFPTGR
jgi:hypothetical protein